MEIVYAYERPKVGFENSVFLAGPSPRCDEDYNWRPEAIEILQNLGFSGSVLIPLPRGGVWSEYLEQVEWELDNLQQATKIVFWIPRSETLPGYTTNVEFGLFVSSGKCILGAPDGALKMKYIRFLAGRYNVPTFSTLEDTLRTAIATV
tara:strand:- start:11753 stop:12199 length:447 start_codon:yes stop_codon:yes gene_type:complete